MARRSRGRRGRGFRRQAAKRAARSGASTSSGSSSFNTSRQSFSSYGLGSNTSNYSGNFSGSSYRGGGGWNTSDQGWGNQYTAAYIAQKAKEEAAAKKKAEGTQKAETAFADYSKVFAKDVNLKTEKPSALSRFAKGIGLVNPMAGLAIGGLAKLTAGQQQPGPSFSTDPGLSRSLGINTSPNTGSQYSRNFQGAYQGPTGPSNRWTDAALGTVNYLRDRLTANPLQSGLSSLGDITFHSLDQLNRLKNVKDTPWAPVNKVKNYLGEYGGALAGLQGAAENLGHYFRAQVDPTTDLNRVGRVLTTERDKIASDMSNWAKENISPERRLQIAAGDQVTASELGDAGSYDNGYVPGFNVAWTNIQRDHITNPEAPYTNLGLSAMEKMSNQLGVDADVGMDMAGNVFNATDNYTFSDEDDFSVPGGKYLHKFNETLKTIGQFTNPDRQTGPGTDGVITKVTYNLADRPAPTASEDFAKGAISDTNLGPSISTGERTGYTRGLGTDTKAARRNIFSSGLNSNLDRSLAQVSGALKSESDQIAQQANLGISSYLDQANKQRAAAQESLSAITTGRTDLAAEIEKLKEGYSDVDVDTSKLEELSGQFATKETDITKQLSDYDQNIRGYVTQWQQATQTPQWTMGVKAQGNIYKSPLQQFGRKARTTSKKIKTPGSEFTIGGLSSAWNPTLNI